MENKSFSNVRNNGDGPVVPKWVRAYSDSTLFGRKLSSPFFIFRILDKGRMNGKL
jgi:hypothetical protein